MSYELHLGDCLEVMRQMPDNSVDAVITDPPYGIGESRARVMSRGKIAAPIDYGDFAWDAKRIDGRYFEEMQRISSNQVIFGGNYYTDYLQPSSSWIVWDKLNGSNDFADCELAWTSHKRAVRRFAYLWNGMIKQKPEERYHPTQKPLSLMIWVLEHYTKPGDIVLDPFAGSFTTGVACIQTGRIFIGCEKDPDYFVLGQKRIQDAAAQLHLFAMEADA